MPEKNIVIAGGGFAGVSALRRLGRRRRIPPGEFNILLIDRKPHFEFLPMLPDAAGGWVDPGLLRYDLKFLAGKERAEFIKGDIKAIDPGNKAIMVDGTRIGYEYLILAAGSETNFYGNMSLRASCLKLDDVDDAVKVTRVLLERTGEGRFVNVIVAGGGYTGVEIATNIDIFLKGRSARYRVYILEREMEILAALPVPARKYISSELRGLGIEIIYGDTLEEYDGDHAVLGSGRTISAAVCVWAAGVRVPGLLKGMPRDLRIKVDKTLRPEDAACRDIFVAGDNSSFSAGPDGKSLRMAVMFSMGQGRTAAANVVNSITGKPLKEYYPLDLGYVVPMAHGNASGTVMGAGVKGKPGYFLHYFMCVYRSEWKNKAGILRALFRRTTKRNKKRRTAWKKEI